MEASPVRAYTEPILAAAWLFPFVAGMSILPYMVVQYRRYGAILLLRTVVLYSFILYLMCAYFLTMLPLPTRAEVASLTTPYLQLEPFKDVVNWVRDAHFSLTDPASWKRLLVSRDLFVMVANVVMTIPFGIYLRYYFGCSLRKTLLFTLALSLSFELIQLSALFGIYPRPYRLCETDDLITNTLGGYLGYRLAGLLMRALPSRTHMDEVAYRRGAHVSVTRRVTAAIVDWSIAGVGILVLLGVCEPLRRQVFDYGYAVGLSTLGALYVAAVALYFMLGEWLQKGLTVGKRLTHLRLIDERDQGRPKLWQCAVRYAVLYYGFAPLPFAALGLFLFAVDGHETNWLLLLLGILAILLFLTGLTMVGVAVISHSRQLPHGAFSRTRNVSTLPITEELLDRVGQQPSFCPPLDVPPDRKGPMLNG